MAMSSGRVASSRFLTSCSTSSLLRTEAEKTEMTRKHEFKLLMQDLDFQIKTAKADRQERKEILTKAMEEKAKAESDLVETTKTRDDDVKYHATLISNCETKAHEFEKRQALRAEELEAIKQAIEIISSSSVSGHAETYLPALLQKGKTSLVSLRADRFGELSKTQAANYLRKRAEKL